MSDPFLIQRPALISFSFGRTSAYMLWRILQAHGGTLPDDVFVCFANTGKEREETLRFGYECGSRWGVGVNWLEFETDLKSAGPEGRFKQVGYNSASRNGEPFDRLIARKQAVPSTITGRWCTSFLKIEPMADFMRSKGFESGQFVEVIGLRSDENDRVQRNKVQARKRGCIVAHPLADAGIRKDDVFAFWKAQPFDLQLPRGYGNCDHCPFVGDRSRIARARFDPAGVEWWARHELTRKFRMGRTFSFVEVLGLVAQSPTLDPNDDADAECGTWCAAGAA